MSLRVVGGEWRGRRLQAPPGGRVRPSLGKLREALFSSLAPRPGGLRVADLFAGSGSLGIEALSRGAAHVLFVELDPRTLTVLHANLDGLGVGPDRATVRRADARRWLRRTRRDGVEVDLILMDPPYQAGVVPDFLPPAVALIESGQLECLVWEHPGDVPVDDLPLGGVRATTRTFGEASFTRFERPSA